MNIMSHDIGNTVNFQIVWPGNFRTVDVNGQMYSSKDKQLFPDYSTNYKSLSSNKAHQFGRPFINIGFDFNI